MDETSALKPDPPFSNLRRRNSITVPVAVPSKLNLLAATKPSRGAEASPPLPLAFELVPIKSSSSGSSPSLAYTSLRDILPSNTASSSPTAASAANSGYEISIRNRLVKQAAWAYLQPMSSSPGSSGPHLLRRIWLRFSACLSFLNLPIISSITNAFDRIFRVVGINFV
ncbi:putative COPII coat assembly protein SEC16 [Cucumis melo var. makuwa]|uniref:COPII coat assembly protein SEC16 n=2 Tax=Cucumis melo TaxID=3656 RepID=A0A5A7TKK1_CUCMM|nr:putative COPII coat assembly protein SEC16 [Cucumis melo var. makuwa]TYK25301.1 putative COPII coat assembly protein SEC16 [Cucumis melo var. makuwa]